MKLDKRSGKRVEFKRYSEEFKRMVVTEYETGSNSLLSVQKKYYIAGGNTLRNWINKYSKSESLPQKVNIEMKGESLRKDVKISELEKQVKQLKEALADETLGKKCVEAEFLAWKRLAGDDVRINVEKKSRNITQ